jgi:aquaporin rerated protein, other eukaryote
MVPRPSINTSLAPVPPLSHQQTLNIDDLDRHFLARVDPIREFLSHLLSRLPKSTRGHVVASIGELIGTTIFFILAFTSIEVATISTRNDAGTAADSRPTQLSTDQLLYMSLGVGFSLAVTAWTWFRVSGGLFNPSVSDPAVLTRRFLAYYA